MFILRFETWPEGVEHVRQGGTRTQTWRDLSDAVCAHGYSGPGWWAMEFPRLGTFRLDRAAPETIRVFAEPGASRMRLDDLYRRSVLPLFLQALGSETLHASAVTAARGVLAFCGERGAGKSTIAYALRRRGFAQHADDTLVVTVNNGVTTQPLPFTPRLRPASADYFERTLAIDEREAPGDSLPQPLAAVFVLRPVSDAQIPDVEILTPARALQAMLAHAHCFEPDDAASRRRLLRNYLEISGHVPVLTVSYQPGLNRLDTLLDTILAAAGEPSPAAIAV